MIYSIFAFFISTLIFLFGITALNKGLIETVDYKLKHILYIFTGSPLKGVIMGTLFTAFIQSSSSATVIFIGLLNAKIISLEQSLGLIFGSNIGTTITSQIISFNIEKSALPFGISGLILFLFGKDNIKQAGKALLGLCLLFWGLHGIKYSLATLQSLSVLKQLLNNIEDSPSHGFLWGIIFTTIVQSSSAAGAVTISLAENGLITIDSATSMILGQNVGTCATAVLAAVGGSYNAKRAAAAHFLFNFIGSILAMSFYASFLKKTAILISPTNIMRQIANIHTMFNIVNTVFFLPWVHYYAVFLRWLIPGGDER